MLLWCYTTGLNKQNNPFSSWAVYRPSSIKKRRETRKWYQLVGSCRRQCDASQSVIHFAAVLKSRVYSFKESKISFFKKERKYNPKNTAGSKIYIATTLRKQNYSSMKMAAFNYIVWCFSLSFHETLEETLKLRLNLVQFYFWCFRLSRLIVFVTTNFKKSVVKRTERFAVIRDEFDGRVVLKFT